MYQLTVKGHFDAAHYLRGYPGKCCRCHGHTFKYEIRLSRTELDEMGLLMDFVEVKRIAEQFDHKTINEVDPFTTLNPTAENIAKQIYIELPRGVVDIVTIWESDNCSASYYE